MKTYQKLILKYVWVADCVVVLSLATALTTAGYLMGVMRADHICKDIDAKYQTIIKQEPDYYPPDEGADNE